MYIDGEPVTFENGFGVNSPTELYFDVSGLNIERLQGYAGIDVDKQKTQDGCYAVIRADGEEVYRSDLLRRNIVQDLLFCVQSDGCGVFQL